MGQQIKSLTIEGFKSIRSLKDFEMKPLNILIGANGSGKSNFVGFFEFLNNVVRQWMRLYVAKKGGVDPLLFNGPKHTNALRAKISLESHVYEFELGATEDHNLVFANEKVCIPTMGGGYIDFPLGQGHQETLLPKAIENLKGRESLDDRIVSYVLKSLSGLVVYHFHDTTETADVRRWRAINDNEYLRNDGSNLSPYLFLLKETKPVVYRRIIDAVRLVAPFFDDFNLRPIPTTPDKIQLEWKQIGSDYPFLPSQLSDGTLRFICLATALLQDPLPSTLIFDEPELGLHPQAIEILAALMKNAVKRGCQIIATTQSVTLLNEFEPKDVIVVDRKDGQSTFNRLNNDEYTRWLEEYTLGELWQKDVFNGGHPNPEFIKAGMK